MNLTVKQDGSLYCDICKFIFGATFVKDMGTAFGKYHIDLHKKVIKVK